MVSTLVCRNVTVSGHRTSIRLEPEMWDALHELCRREGKSVNAVCSMVDRARRASALTSALRVFIVTYFRAATTERGHWLAGHGAFREETAAVSDSTGESPISLPHREERAYDPV